MRNKEELIKELMKKCIEVAANEKTIHYCEIMDYLGLDVTNIADRNFFGELMGGVNEMTASPESVEQGYLLTSVIVHKSFGKPTEPGEGYFDLARDIKMLKNQNKYDFWREELNECYRRHSARMQE